MRKPDVDFRALDDFLAKVFGPRSTFWYERTLSGVTTQVYRLRRGAQVFYVRIGEDAEDSFAAEACLHTALRHAGVRVPAVIHMEPFDQGLDRSVMVTSHIRGAPINAATPASDVARIYRAAGRDLARIHSIAVQGFDWIQRGHHQPGWPLRGQTATYPHYVNPAAVASALINAGLTSRHVDQIERLLEEAVGCGPAGTVGHLAHGDFDITHIFEWNGNYAGIIDFGEIRSTDYTFDLATLQLHTHTEWVARAYKHVEEGYTDIDPLPDDHQRRLYLACILSTTHRLYARLNRDGQQAVDTQFFRQLQQKLINLLTRGHNVLRR